MIGLPHVLLILCIIVICYLLLSDPFGIFSCDRSSEFKVPSEKCAHCKGERKVICYQCKGAKTYKAFHYWWGYYQPWTFRCYDCLPTGYIECKHCFG